MKGRIDPAIVSEKFLAGILATLNDPQAAWWEQDGALFALGRANPEDIREQLGQLMQEGFLIEAPWCWLQHYPRFLQAVFSAARLPALLAEDRGPGFRPGG